MTFAPPDAPTDRGPRPQRGGGLPWAAPASQQGAGGTSSGVNIAPGSDDDGWEVPPPARLRDGSEAQLYKDGEALHAAYQAIRSARTGVRLEIYIFHSDATGRAFADLLARRAREGLDVRVMFDSIGSADADPAMFKSMRAAGVWVREFHPINPWHCTHGWRPFNRDHRKLVVADGEVAVLGGQNLGNEYGSSWVVGESTPDAWRDTAAGVRGPSVRLLSESFDRIWDYVEHGGPIRRAALFKKADDGDGELFHEQPSARRAVQPDRLSPRPSVLDVPPDSPAVLASVPTPRSPLVPALQKLLRDAKSSIELTMAYFAPPEELVDQLCRSARAGVRVRLMLPGRSDVRLLLIAARAFYDPLLAAGAEVYERQYAILHAKSLCIDGCLSIVGSTNLDYRSIQFNCELSMLVHSAAFGSHMHELFEHDVRFAQRILPGSHRPTRGDRLVQWACARARYFL
jgi:cardiolipin synthase